MYSFSVASNPAAATPKEQMFTKHGHLQINLTKMKKKLKLLTNQPLL
uniref:Uncharacterized protein n=1 Tax=Arundo donax TaxID=35708 RepID=A0A0A9DR48_ARUDO